MKKNLLILIVLANSFAGLNAQTINNAGFENWYTNSLGRLDVTGWETSNIYYSAASVVQDVPYAGSHSAKLKSVNDGGGNYVGGEMEYVDSFPPGTPKPTSLKGYYKHNVSGFLDGFGITITLFDAAFNVIGSGSFNGPLLSNVTNFTMFTANISGSTPPTYYRINAIYYNDGTNPFGYAVVDGLTLTFPAAIEEFDNTVVSIFPNPANSFLDITKSTEGHAFNTIRIYDFLGKEVYRSDNLSTYNYQVDVSAFQNGAYVISAVAGDKIFNKKLLINK